MVRQISFSITDWGGRIFKVLDLIANRHIRWFESHSRQNLTEPLSSSSLLKERVLYVKFQFLSVFSYLPDKQYQAGI